MCVKHDKDAYSSPHMSNLVALYSSDGFLGDHIDILGIK